MDRIDSRISVPPDAQERGGGRIPLDQVESPIMLQGIDYWRRLCGARKYPARTDLSPRDIASVLRNTILLKVIDEGADYEYRIVGDAHVIAHGFSMQGMRWSDVDRFSPGYGPVLKGLYDRVLRKREPYALRGWIARGDSQRRYVYSESAFLPLGADDSVIDHVLNFSVYTPHDG